MDFTLDERERASRFVTYVLRDMASLWATHGRDHAGRRGRERLQFDRADSNLGYRRSMVVGRQLFFFSHAFRLTHDPVFGDHAHDLFLDLNEHFWDPVHGGWYFSVSDDASPPNMVKDLYAHAFVLFGLAHYYAIFRNADALTRIGDTHALVGRCFLSPRSWFAHSASREWGISNRALEQNPHMHLLETYLSVHGALEDPSFLGDARRLVAIFSERLLTPDGSKVLEHFDEDGRPAAKNGEIIEPGHLYEWYWLLNEYADIANEPRYAQLVEPVFEWAEKWGLDATGGIYDLIDVQGRPVSDRKRIWPVTEAIKASTTRVRILRDAKSRAALFAWIGFITDKYFAGGGSWHEYLTGELRPDSDYMPASTPYHAAMAALEVERLLGGPGAFGLRQERLARTVTLSP